MDQPLPELKVGETVRATITKRLHYDITNDGWTIRVASSKRLAVQPNPDGSVNIVCTDIAEDNEV